MKFLRFSVALAVALVSPGLLPYQALARVVSVRVRTPVNPAPNAGAGSRATLTGSLSRSALSNLSGSFAPLPSFTGPSVRSETAAGAFAGLSAVPAAPDISVAGPSLGSIAGAPADADVRPAPFASPSIFSPQAGPTDSDPAAKPGSPAGRRQTAGSLPPAIGRKFAALMRAFRARPDPGTVPAGPVGEIPDAFTAARFGLTPTPAPPSDPGLKTQGGRAQPPAAAPVAAEDGTKSKGKGWLGLGAVVAALIGGMLVMQLGLEAQGAAMAQLTEDAFGDFSILAQVTIFASIGSIIGQQLSQFFSGKFGLTKTFYGAHVLRAASLGAMVFLLGTGMMPLPLMFLFYALNGIVTGIAVTAEGTLRKFLLAQQGVSQQKFRTWWQLLAEIVAVPAPMVLGALVLSVGAGWITALYPATILAGLMVFLMLKVIPWNAARRIEALAAPAAPAPAASPAPDAPAVGRWQRIKNAFKQIFVNMEEGKEFVFKTPFLKYSLMGAVIFDLMNVLIYRLITPGYGKLVAGSAGMAAVQGNLVGMFSLGGLLLAATFLLLERFGKKRHEAMSPEEKSRSERASMLRWTLWGVPALALLGVMAFNLTLPFAPLMFMDVNWIPSTVLAAALIPFGFFQVAASIKLNSYFNEKLPPDPAKVQKALAFSGSAMTALSIVVMLALKPLFGDLAGFNPFPWLAAALVPLGALLFFIQRKLAAATKPAEGAAANRAGTEKGAGGFVGVLLGVVAAALVLSALPFIPGLGGLVAGLGVLGKFALHVGVALALPAAGFFADRALRRRPRLGP